MTSKNKIIVALLPLAWIYGLIQWTRNLLYDKGLLKSKKAPLRTLVIGNLAVGGTGKTPHVIWLATELSKTYRIAILSRGYGRNSKGFHWVQKDDHPQKVGDEPLEMKNLLPDIPIAVDGNRLRALDKIQEEINPPPDLVVLDDGFQHRRLKPDYSIILSHADRPAYHDQMMPAGRLREGLNSIHRANSLIITNNTGNMNNSGWNELRESFRLMKDQNLYHTSFQYKELEPINESAKSLSPQQANSILLITGIALPADLLIEMESRSATHMIRFPDHHNYSQKDAQKIVSSFHSMEGTNKILVTTGKDAMKLKYFTELKPLPMYRLNRQVIMEDEQKNKLLASIMNHG